MIEDREYESVLKRWKIIFKARIKNINKELKNLEKMRNETN